MVSIRLAEMQDFEAFYQIKCEPSNIFWAGFNAPPMKERLLEWFKDKISRQANHLSRKIYMISDNNTPPPRIIGYIYIDPVTLSECETSIAISESFWGYHYARTALKLTEDLASQWGFSRIVGEIREDNIASIKMHTAWGVTLTDSYRLIDIPQLHREIKMLRFYKDIKGTQ